MAMILRGLNDLLACSLSQMLLNLHKKTWMDGLTLQDYDDHCALNQKTVKVTIGSLERSDLGETGGGGGGGGGKGMCGASSRSALTCDFALQCEGFVRGYERAGECQ